MYEKSVLSVAIFGAIYFTYWSKINNQVPLTVVIFPCWPSIFAVALLIIVFGDDMMATSDGFYFFANGSEVNFSHFTACTLLPHPKLYWFLQSIVLVHYATRRSG